LQKAESAEGRRQSWQLAVGKREKPVGSWQKGGQKAEGRGKKGKNQLAVGRGQSAEGIGKCEKPVPLP
jgi:hypothetical protein